MNGFTLSMQPDLLPVQRLHVRRKTPLLGHCLRAVRPAAASAPRLRRGFAYLATHSLAHAVVAKCSRSSKRQRFIHKYQTNSVLWALVASRKTTSPKQSSQPALRGQRANIVQAQLRGTHQPAQQLSLAACRCQCTHNSSLNRTFCGGPRLGYKILAQTQPAAKCRLALR